MDLAVAVDLLVTALIAAALLRWGGFLALAIADAWRQRRDGPDPADVEPLTVVIPAWNEAAVIERTVTSALGSDLDALQVIVVDDGSTDDTAARVDALCAREPRLSLLRQPQNAGKSEALNAGLRAATTRLVATLDADTLVDTRCLRWLVAAQRRHGAAAVCANVRVGNRSGLLTRWQSLEYIAGLNLDRRALNRLGAITTVPGAAALWSRDAVLRCGGFSGDTLAEDTDLSIALLRAGERLVFEDRADAFTEAPTTLWGLYRQRRRWLTGNLACIRKHGLAPGAPWAARWVGMPNLWFLHLGVYLLPIALSVWVALGRAGEELPLVLTLGGAAVTLDWLGLLWFYAWDRTDWRDLPHAPLHRLLYPWVAWAVFGSVLLWPPRSWAKIARRNDASVG